MSDGCPHWRVWKMLSKMDRPAKKVCSGWRRVFWRAGQIKMNKNTSAICAPMQGTLFLEHPSNAVQENTCTAPTIGLNTRPLAHESRSLPTERQCYPNFSLVNIRAYTKLSVRHQKSKCFFFYWMESHTCSRVTTVVKRFRHYRVLFVCLCWCFT